VLNLVTVCQPHLHFHLSPTTVRVQERDRWHHPPRPGGRIVGAARQFRETTKWLYSTSVQTRWLRRAERAEPQPQRTGLNGHRSRPMRPSIGEMTPSVRRIEPGSTRSVVGDRPIAPVQVPARTMARHTSFAVFGEWHRTARRRRLPAYSLATEPPAAGHQPRGSRGPLNRRRSMQPAQIVWRGGAQARPSVPDTLVAMPARSSSASRAFANAGATQGPATPDAPVVPPRQTAVRYADFEPGLLDRLTDDVIHRVERRVRIERERRGL
jgi:hypothetical protein